MADYEPPPPPPSDPAPPGALGAAAAAVADGQEGAPGEEEEGGKKKKAKAAKPDAPPPNTFEITIPDNVHPGQKARRRAGRGGPTRRGTPDPLPPLSPESDCAISP